MNESILELLTEVTLYELMWALLLVVTIAGILISQKKRISKWMDKWRTDKNEEEDFHSFVYGLKDSITEIEKTMKQFQENRIHDREDSIAIRSEIYKSIDINNNAIKELTKITLEIQEKNSKTKRAEIKERIERIYRECHPTMVCTDMQMETLKELIEEYEEHGGENSFVHSIVEPEMYQWKIINKIEEEE